MHLVPLAGRKQDGGLRNGVLRRRLCGGQHRGRDGDEDGHHVEEKKDCSGRTRRRADAPGHPRGRGTAGHGSPPNHPPNQLTKLSPTDPPAPHRTANFSSMIFIYLFSPTSNERTLLKTRTRTHQKKKKRKEKERNSFISRLDW